MVNEQDRVLAAKGVANECKCSQAIINGITFYYDPQNLNFTEHVFCELEAFSYAAKEKVYSVCRDEDDLIIY